MSVKIGEVFEEAKGSVLPGEAMADLDWDDEEEATNVFDRDHSDLFSNLAPKSRGAPDPVPSTKRGLGQAAQLLASSGRSAQPVSIKSQPPVAVATPYPEPLPRIPAPAPVPRDISPMPARDEQARAPHPSWAPAAPPPQRASSGGKTTLILAAVAALVLAAAGFFYLRSSAAATVEIHVTHDGKEVEKANIYVDGQKKCEFAPCKLDLKPGPKQVRVVSGGLAGQVAIDVEGGKDMNVAVPLDQSDEAPAEDDAKEPASIELASAMKDVELKVFVNGEDKGTLTADKPLSLEGIDPGKATLRIEGGDEWGKLEKEVELKAGETFKLDGIELPPLKVKVAFELETRGADVKLVKHEGDKKTEEPLAFRGNKAEKELDTTFKWTVVATLKGYEDFDQPLRFEDGKAEQTFEIELQKEKEEKVASSTPAPTPSPSPRAKPSPRPNPTGGGSGFINANSIPPSKVIIGGRPYGSTPVTGVKVNAGSHTVIFKHPEFGTEARTVTVGNGQTKTATVRFKKKEE